MAGYRANVEQSASSLDAIHGLMTLAPTAIMDVMIVAVYFYQLDEATHTEIVASLKVGS